MSTGPFIAKQTICTVDGHNKHRLTFKGLKEAGHNPRHFTVAAPASTMKERRDEMEAHVTNALFFQDTAAGRTSQTLPLVVTINCQGPTTVPPLTGTAKGQEARAKLGAERKASFVHLN